MEVLRACRFGFMGGCVKKLKTMGESGVERIGEGLEERGVFGLWWSYGRGFAARWWWNSRAGEAVALWSVSGAERAARGGSGEASVCGDSGGCSGRFEIPRSRRAGRQQRPRASLDSRLWCLGGRVWNLARRGADRDAKIEPAARKMANVRRSHLMHPMNQVHKMSHSR